MDKPLSDSEVEFVENRIRDCRIKLRGQGMYPYMAHALMQMTLIPSYKVPTMGVDKYWRCYYNPITISAWSDANICGVLIHELGHLLRRHCKRSLPPPEIWNIAADMEINDTINKKGIELPGNCYYPKTYKLADDLTAEEYYDYILKNKTLVKQLEAEGDGDGKGQKKGKGDKPDNGQFGGSCSDGVDREWEESGDSNNAKSEQEADFIIEKTARDIKSCGIGDMPASLKIWADKVLQSKVDWRAKLRNVTNAVINPIRGTMRSSFKFPSRRSGEFIWPGKYNPNPNVLVIHDTSGSMNGLEADCLAEVKGILKSVPSKNITYVCGDTQTANKKKVRKIEDVDMSGGGGTDMGAIIEQNWKGNDLVIVITDAYTPWCKPIPKKVICCAMTDEPVPSWIETIRVKPEERFNG